MKALILRSAGSPFELAEVPRPEGAERRGLFRAVEPQELQEIDLQDD